VGSDAKTGILYLGEHQSGKKFAKSQIEDPKKKTKGEGDGEKSESMANGG